MQLDRQSTHAQVNNLPSLISCPVRTDGPWNCGSPMLGCLWVRQVSLLCNEGDPILSDWVIPISTPSHGKGRAERRADALPCSTSTQVERPRSNLDSGQPALVALLPAMHLVCFPTGYHWLYCIEFRYWPDLLRMSDLVWRLHTFLSNSHVNRLVGELAVITLAPSLSWRSLNEIMEA